MKGNRLTIEKMKPGRRELRRRRRIRRAIRWALIAAVAVVAGYFGFPPGALLAVMAIAVLLAFDLFDFSGN